MISFKRPVTSLVLSVIWLSSSESATQFYLSLQLVRPLLFLKQELAGLRRHHRSYQPTVVVVIVTNQGQNEAYTMFWLWEYLPPLSFLEKFYICFCPQICHYSWSTYNSDGQTIPCVNAHNKGRGCVSGVYESVSVFMEFTEDTLESKYNLSWENKIFTFRSLIQISNYDLFVLS